MPAEATPTISFGLEVGSGVARLGKNEQELFGLNKLSGRALYDDGQMINVNVINHVTKEPLG